MEEYVERPSADSVSTGGTSASAEAVSGDDGKDLMTRIGQIIDRVSQTPAESTPSSATPAIAHTPTGNSGTSADGLAALLSNPALLESLPGILATVKPLLASMTPPPRPREAHKSLPDRRDDLLLALKPFLSTERQQAVDMILRLAKLGILLRHLK